MNAPANRTILLATGNPGKLREIRDEMGHLAVRWLTLDQLDAARRAPAPAESSECFSGNAAEKARYYSLASGLWTLADDSGLVVDALGGAPGVHSARYAGPARDDAANNAELLAALGDVPPERRSARFICALALADGDRILLTADGVIEGRIAPSPRGDNGFGYDPLFFVPELGCTTAELTAAEKNRISHRGRAVRALHAKLRALLGEQGD